MPRPAPTVASGERRSAGLERRAPRRGDNGADTIDMLDRDGNNRHRQLRRGGGERIAQQRDGGTDRAVIVAALAVTGGRGRRLIRRYGGGGRSGGAGAAENILAMDVAERQDKLYRQRE